MILILKVFRRLLNSFNAILTTVLLQRKSQKRISRSSAWLFTFYRRKYFFVYGWQLNIFCFHFKSAEWPGNFDVCSPEVSLRIISFRCPFGLTPYTHPLPSVSPSTSTVNLFVSQLIYLTTFSVSKWVNAATLPLPSTQCMSFCKSNSL